MALPLHRLPLVTAPQKRTLVIGAISVAAILFIALIIYAIRLNSRLSAEIVDAPWKNPVEILSVLTPGGQPIARLYGDDWRVSEPVRLRDLPPHVARAFQAAEDVRFESNLGVDPTGMLRAAVANVRGHRLAQGGSTITQQLIKQKLFSNARTFRRKIPEIFLALLLTLRMSKDDILEGYLNDVYLGQYGGVSVLGVDEAARIYFNKAPGALTPDEAALIAGTIRAPNRNNPFDRPEEALTRRNSILGTMRDQHWITDDEYQQSMARPIRLHPGRLADAPLGHYLSAVRTELASLDVSLPKSGIRVMCEIDPHMQLFAETAALDGVRRLQARYPSLRGRRDLQTAILSADPRTGGIRALVGSRDYREDVYDRTRRMHRQPGSAIKPFVYAAALDSRKFTTSSVLLDEPLTVKLDRKHSWSPLDYDDRFRGPVTLRTALEESLNVPTVRLAQSVGLDKVVATLKKAGFAEDFPSVPSLPLGVTEVTLRELVNAYQLFPSLGERTPLHLVSEVLDKKGKGLYRFQQKRERLLDPGVAWLVNDILRGVVLHGTASRLADDGLDFVAGKTGTTSDYRDAWFIGYAPDLVTGLWLGCDGGSPLRLSAGEAAVPLWSSLMQHVRMSRNPIQPPMGIVLKEIDPDSGTIWARGCNGPITEAYLSGTEPKITCNGERVGRREVFAKVRGDVEPGAISEEQAQRHAPEGINSDEVDTPEDLTPSQHGRVPEVSDEEGDASPSDESVQPAPRRAHHPKHHKRHRHHRGGNSLPSILRRIFG